MNSHDKQIATDLAYEMIREVGIAIRPYVGKVESGEKVKIGADGTPTSLIDMIAEDKIINILKNAPVLSYIVSEEIGELKLGKGTKRSIVLTQESKRTDLNEDEIPKFIFLIDPVDGTSNAIKEIPAFGISIAVANVHPGKLSTLNDVELGFVSNFANGNFFEAVKGKGCWLNNEKVTPSDNIKISLRNSAASGKVAYGDPMDGRKADEKKAVENALQCFDDGMVALFADGIRYTDRQEKMALKEQSEVTFIRLTFLAGRMW